MTQLVTTIKNLQDRKYLTLKHLMDSELWDSIFKKYYDSGILNPRQLIFHASNNIGELPLCICGNKLKWNPDDREYRKFCCSKCAGLHSVEKNKATNLKKYGVEWASQRGDHSEKIIEASLRKFGSTHYSQTQEFHDRVISSNVKKFGVAYPAQSKDVKERIEQLTIEKYGVASNFQRADVKEKIKASNLTKYGKENVLSCPEIRDKVAATNISRYGVKVPLQNANLAAKAGDTRKSNYYAPSVLEKLNNADWLASSNLVKTIGELAAELGVSSSNLNKYFHKHSLPIVAHTATELERKFKSYFESKNISVELHNRSIISPMEVDVYFPDFKLGIEINGGYWHSEQFVKSQSYHLGKIIAAEKAGITLMQFWDWELNDKWDIITSRIEHLMNLSTKVFARKLSLINLDSESKREFLDQNHIQGDCASSINYGLIDENGELFMVATFGKSRFTKKASYELLRLSAKKKYAVVGGASKLIKHFISEQMKDDETMISYCHRRFSSGRVYSACGFTATHTTAPGYVYTKAGRLVGSRNAWQKHKLKDKLLVFDPQKSEVENMKHNGYYRAFDSGQIVFAFTNQRV
jgi:very-short-patch-repair endonuclease